MIYTSREVYEYISKQTGDPIVERKTCRISGQPFPIYQSDLDFYNKISPTFDGKKFQIPTPTLCPEERQRRRLSFRNERKLYKRTCDATGENMISIYSPDKPYKVYNQKFRRSDGRDPMDYGRDFDFSRSFTEQFGELMGEVPRISLNKDLGVQSDNCDYTNEAGGNKNCYMVTKTGYAQDCLHACDVSLSKYCTDCYNVKKSECCYNCIDCYSCFQMIYCKDCSGCSFCIGCYGLENKQYMIYNKQVSKEKFEYFKKFSLIFLKGFIGSNKIFNSQAVRGNNIFNSKNVGFSFDIDGVEDSKYCYDIIPRASDCYDVNIFGDHLSLSMEVEVAGTYSKNLLSCIHINSAQNIYYSQFITQGQNCFGCIGLRNKSYCIFNKQYTKEEYEKLVAKIITHMQSRGERGEFFHPSLSPFGYNETVAMEYYPITPLSEGEGLGVRINNQAEGALSRFGYHRSDYNADPVIPAGAHTLTGDQIPQDITTVTDDILKSIFVCEVSGRPFRIIKQELDFYRKHNIPLPRKHPDVRHEERMKLRPGRTLFLRKCDCCQKEMLSVYAQDHEGKVYCEECYQKEVYG